MGLDDKRCAEVRIQFVCKMARAHFKHHFKAQKKDIKH